MKNNLFKLTALLIVVVGLASCRQEVDVIGITNNLANRNMPGFYSSTTLDSITMTSFKKECYLGEDSTGNHVGYFRTCRAGQGALVDVERPITWKAIMSEDRLSMKVTATFEDGSEKNLLWKNGMIDDGENEYAKTVSGQSDVNVELSIIADLENTKYVYEETSYYKHLVPTPYLEWKSTVTFYAPADTAAEKARIQAELEQQLDTIVWFLREISPTHSIGIAYLDTIFEGGDTTFTVANMVSVDPTASTRGKNKGKHGITYLVSKVAYRDIQTDDRPQSTISSVMEFKRVNDVNTALYTYEIHEWSEKYYDDPTNPAAISHDSIYTMTASAWMITEYTNPLKFNVQLFGNTELTEIKTEGGVETLNKHELGEKVYQTLNISGYSKKKGEATQAGLKYKLQ